MTRDRPAVNKLRPDLFLFLLPSAVLSVFTSVYPHVLHAQIRSPLGHPSASLYRAFIRPSFSPFFFASVQASFHPFFRQSVTRPQIVRQRVRPSVHPPFGSSSIRPTSVRLAVCPIRIRIILSFASLIQPAFVRPYVTSDRSSARSSVRPSVCLFQRTC